MNINLWPNGLGATVTDKSIEIAVWLDGRASRIGPDGYKTHWAKFPVEPIDDLCKTALIAWKQAKRAWNKIED